MQQLVERLCGFGSRKLAHPPVRENSEADTAVCQQIRLLFGIEDKLLDDYRVAFEHSLRLDSYRAREQADSARV
jgi:hypothetical protein